MDRPLALIGLFSTDYCAACALSPSQARESKDSQPRQSKDRTSSGSVGGGEAPGARNLCFALADIQTHAIRDALLSSAPLKREVLL